MVILKELSIYQIIVIIIALGLIFFWLYKMIGWINKLLHTYTFNTKYKNPYANETLGLPPGTLRGVLTLTLLIVVIILVCLSMLVNQLQGAYDELVNAFEIVLAFYFGNRIVNGISKTDEEKTQKRLNAEVEKTKAEVAARSQKLNNSPSGDSFEVTGSVG